MIDKSFPSLIFPNMLALAQVEIHDMEYMFPVVLLCRYEAQAEVYLQSIRGWSQRSQKALVSSSGIPEKSCQAETLVSKIFIRNK